MLLIDAQPPRVSLVVATAVCVLGSGTVRGGTIMRRFINSWNATLTRLGYKKTSSLRPRPATYHRSLRVEGLEERCMLAGVTVSINNDVVNGNTASIAALIASNGGDGISLREAIIAANNSTEADTIDFASSLQNSTITLSNGELPINQPLTINGLGADLLTIDASGNDATPNVNNGDGSRIFQISAANTSLVTIKGLSLTGGDAPGSESGGAIDHNTVDLDLDDLKIFNNAAGRGGGVALSGSVGTVVQIKNSIIGHQNEGQGNVASSGFGGGGVYIQGAGRVTIESSQVLKNIAVGPGAGIHVEGTPALNPAKGHFELRDSLVEGNRSDGDGGGLYFTAGGSLSTNPEEQGYLVVTRSKISGNVADGAGGGLWVASSVTDAPGSFYAAIITDCIFSENEAYGDNGFGGEGNKGGGGIYLTTGVDLPMLVSNSTISGNRALNGGGILIESAPGDNSGDVRIHHSTIAYNTAGPFFGNTDPNIPDESKQRQGTAGGGVMFFGTWGWGPSDASKLPSFEHTIIANNEHLIDEQETGSFPFKADREPKNVSHDLGVFPLPIDPETPGNFPDIVAGDPLDSPFFTFSADYTLIGNVGPHYYLNVYTLSGTGNILGGSTETGSAVDPLLQPLADNGAWFTLPDGVSKIQTHALAAGSPAIDAGALSGDFPPFDQRGVPYVRVYGPSIDIGAFEVQPLKPQPPDITLPMVTNVIINSTVNGNYQKIPYQFDGVVGSKEQLRTVPVGAANQISIRFSEDMIVDDNDLELISLNRTMSEPTRDLIQEPDANNAYTAIWSLSSPLQAAQYLLRLSDSIEDADGNSLDGEWTNPGKLSSIVTTSVFPSGDGLEGGDFEFVFTILPGDMNRNNNVTNADNGAFSAALNNPSSLDPRIVGLADINLDGSVTNADVTPYGNVLSGPAYLRQLADLAIVANLEGNDFDVDDYDADFFIAYFNAGDIRADMNKDGVLTFADTSLFGKYYSFGIDLDVLI